MLGIFVNILCEENTKKCKRVTGGKKGDCHRRVKKAKYKEILKFFAKQAKI